MIFIVVNALEQTGLAVEATDPTVVTGGNSIGTQNLCVIEEHLKFDFTIAENVRIGRTACAVLLEEVLKHIVPVVRRKVGCVQGDIELIANLLSIG